MLFAGTSYSTSWSLASSGLINSIISKHVPHFPPLFAIGGADTTGVWHEMRIGQGSFKVNTAGFGFITPPNVFMSGALSLPENLIQIKNICKF